VSSESTSQQTMDFSMPCTDRASRNGRMAMAALLGSLLSLAACSTATVGSLDGGDGGTPDGSLAVGELCGADSSCQSNICLRRCCAAPCNTSPGHPECSACDATGACTYPPVQCQKAACNPATRTASTAALCSNGFCPAPVTTQCSASCQGDVCGS